MNPKEVIARRIAKEFKDGDVINLGFGIPVAAADYIPEGVDVYLESENGILGFSKVPSRDKVDVDIFTAGASPAELLPMASTFDLRTSFALIRGGHVDKTVIGALEVDQHGNIANWSIPGVLAPGMGGAMDLLAGAKNVIASIQHTDKDGNSKVLKDCTLPLSAAGKVSVIITDLAYFEVTDGYLLLKEVAPGVSVEEVLEKTEADVRVAEDVHEFEI